MELKDARKKIRNLKIKMHNTNPKFSLRNPLLYLLLAGAVLLGSNEISRRENWNKGKGLEMKLIEEGIKEADSAFRNFPSEIPGAAKVEKYETPGARYCLVHIRQIHPRSSSDIIEILGDLHSISKKSENLGIEGKIRSINMINSTYQYLKEEYFNINRVQKDIYDIISYLVKNNNISKIRSEGFCGGGERTNQEIRNIYKFSQQVPCVVMGIEIPDKIEDFNESIKYIAGANILLGVEKKIKILPAEDPKLNRLGSDNNLEIRYKGREDFLLKLISKDYNPLQITTFGGGHSFKDNIDEWNKKNPYNQFSLIEITPKSYDQANTNMNNLKIDTGQTELGEMK